MKDSAKINVCPKCARTVERIPSEHCPICGMPTDLGSLICWSCASNKRYYNSHRSVYYYKDKVRGSVIRMKFGDKPHYTETMGKLMSAYVSTGYDFVTAVPLSRKKFRKRGYNQSRLLAESVCLSCGLEFRETLLKVKETSVQSRLKFSQRLKNVSGAYKAIADVKGRKILLIDDVFTTGATANECAKVLRRAGAASVDCVTFAMSYKKGDFNEDKTD